MSQTQYTCDAMVSCQHVITFMFILHHHCHCQKVWDLFCSALGDRKLGLSAFNWCCLPSVVGHVVAAASPGGTGSSSPNVLHVASCHIFHSAVSNNSLVSSLLSPLSKPGPKCPNAAHMQHTCHGWWTACSSWHSWRQAGMLCNSEEKAHLANKSAAVEFVDVSSNGLDQPLLCERGVNGLHQPLVQACVLGQPEWQAPAQTMRLMHVMHCTRCQRLGESNIQVA